MKKSPLMLLLFLSSLTVITAQKNKSFFVELGGAYTSFQDVKYSAVSFGGAGVAFKLGFERSTPNAMWEFGLDGNVGLETANTNNNIDATSLHPKFYVHYLKKVNDQLSIGAHWDIFGSYLRFISGLDNNGNYYLTSSDLFATGDYQKGKWNFGLDLGLASFQKERLSFAFSTPQNALEDGRFNYQDDKLDDPLSLKYATFKPIGQQLYLRTRIQFQLNERISMGYQWTARHFAEVSNYPVTVGSHQVVARFNLTQKIKSANPKN